MFEPDSVEVRMVDLARRLLAQTEAGRVVWRRTDRAGQFLYATRHGSVTIESPPGTLGRLAPTYTLRALDRAGQEVESLQATSPGALVKLHPAPPDAYATLAALHEAAERQAAQRGNALIDELIAEIG